MKGMFDNEETFTAYATIEAGMYMLSQILNQMTIDVPTNPIDALIDEITGFGEEKKKRYQEDIVICLVDIIEAKKIIEADYSRDEQLLNYFKQ